MSFSVLNDHEDMATVKGRPFYIPMSDNDCRELARIAATQGMQPADLLAAFIGDLTGGTHCNGSDEREIARAWLDRTCFELSAAPDFVKYLADRWLIDNAAESMSEVETLREEMQEESEEDAAETAGIIQREEMALHEDFKEYQADTEAPETEAEAMQVLREYTRELDRMLKRNEDAPSMTAQEVSNLLNECKDPAEAIRQAFRMGYAAGKYHE